MKTKIILILIIIVLVLSFFLNKYIHSYNYVYSAYNQNTFAIDSLKMINDSLYQKYVAVIKNLNKKDNTIQKLQEKVLLKDKIIFDLKNIKDSSTVSRIDTIYITKDSSYNVLHFTNSNKIYSYKLDVFLYQVPYHTLSCKFNPFPVTVYLSKNKNNTLSTYIKIPKPYNEFIKISNVTTEIDENFYYNKNNPEGLRFLLGFGFINNFLNFKANLGASYLNKHYILYSYSPNLKQHGFNYIYKF